jgi:hypothetical protein
MPALLLQEEGLLLNLPQMMPLRSQHHSLMNLLRMTPQMTLLHSRRMMQNYLLPPLHSLPLRLRLPLLPHLMPLLPPLLLLRLLLLLLLRPPPP